MEKIEHQNLKVVQKIYEIFRFGTLIWNFSFWY